MKEIAGLLGVLQTQQLNKIDQRLLLLIPQAAPRRLPKPLLGKVELLAGRWEDVLPFLTPTTYEDVRHCAQDIAGCLQALRDLPANLLPVPEALRLLSVVDDQARRFYELMSRNDVVSPANAQQVKRAIKGIEPLMKDLENRMQDIENRAAAAGKSARSIAAHQASELLSAAFDASARRHRNASRRWLAATGASGILLVLVGWLLVAHPERIGLTQHEASDGTQDLFLGELPWKVAIAVSLGFAVYFCARNYRVNRHMTISYESRATVIAAAKMLRDAMEDPADKAAILQTAVMASLSIPPTGCTRPGAEKEDLGLAATMVALAQRASRRGLDGH